MKVQTGPIRKSKKEVRSIPGVLKFVAHSKLYQTGQGNVRALGAQHICGEHAGTISFPNTSLRPIESMRILSGDFIREPHFACLIGRDILRHWTVTFDGTAKRVTITD